MRHISQRSSNDGAALSASRQPSPASVQVPTVDGIDRPCVAVCRAVRGVSRARLLSRLSTILPATMGEIDLALGHVLGLR